MTGVLFALLLAPPPAPESLDSIGSEPDLVKRSERALAFAGASALRARRIVRDSGSRAELFDVLDQTVKALQLSLRSLRETGRKPSRLARQYKRGELRSREIVRQLTDLSAALNVQDRPEAEKLRDQASLVHEEFLLGVMSGK